VRESECVENFQLVVPYVNTLDNDADFFTKSHTAKRFYEMRDRIMNVAPGSSESDDSSCGGGVEGGPYGNEGHSTSSTGAY